jgi:hypothetical protein
MIKIQSVCVSLMIIPIQKLILSTPFILDYEEVKYNNKYIKREEKNKIEVKF